MKESTDIRTLGEAQIREFLEAQGEKAFRAKQIYEWLWKKSCTTFEEMTNLALPLREMLNEHFIISPVQVHTQQVSNDRTIKSRFQLHDGHFIEAYSSLLKTA